MLGETGTPVEVTANYIRLNFKESCVYEYEVKYEPDQDYKNLRFKLLNGKLLLYFQIFILFSRFKRVLKLKVRNKCVLTMYANEILS